MSRRIIGSRPTASSLQYQLPAGSSTAPVDPGFNPLAIVALVLLIVLPPASIVVGHIALGQLKRTPQKGRELALLATVLGYVFTGIAVLFFLIWLLFFGFAIMMWFGAMVAAFASLGDVGGMTDMPLPLGAPAR